MNERLHMREVEEWIGKTPDTPVPTRVRLRIFDRFGGKCYLTGKIIRAGDKWDIEHVVALCNGGENREYNLAPALIAPHKIKTKSDRAQKSKRDRIRTKHFGMRKPKRKLCYRRFDGTPVNPNRSL